MKSQRPKNKATPKLTPTTIKVYFRVSCFDGQVTFFSSVLASFKNCQILLKIFMVFKKPLGALLLLE